MKTSFARIALLGMFFSAASLSAKAVDATDYVKVGTGHLASGEYAKAQAVFTGLIRQEPKNADGWLGRGVAYEYEGEYAAALKDLSHAIRLNPDLTQAYAHRGYVYEAMGKPDKALANFDRALHTVRIGGINDANLYRVRGDAYEVKGDYKQALANYKKAMQIDPKNAWVWNSFAMLFAGCPDAKYRDGKRAVFYAHRAQELSHGKYPGSLDTLARAYAEAGDFAKAVKYEKQYLATPGLSKENAEGARQKLELYEARKPYHEKAK